MIMVGSFHFKCIALFLLLASKASLITVNTTVVTTIDGAQIELQNGSCCCDALLWIHWHYDYENFNCSENENCHMCQSFTLTNLLPFQDYRLELKLPDKSSKTLKFQTKPLEVNFVTNISGSNVTIFVESNYTGTISSCTFSLETEGKLVDSCSFSCQSCSNYTKYSLQKHKTYLLRYKNRYMMNSAEVNFSIDPLPFNFTIKEGFTTALLSIKSDLLQIKKCSIQIRNKTNLVQSINRSACEFITVSNLKPFENYFVEVSINDLNQTTTMDLNTENLFITQSHNQISVDEIEIKVTASPNEIEELSCKIIFDQIFAKCKRSCPTNCGNYSILINITNEFTAKILSEQSKFGSEHYVYPKKLKFDDKNTHYANNLLYTKLEPNLQNAGDCLLKAFIYKIEVKMFCKNSKCPTNCDKLNLVLENMPSNTEITFRITNKFLQDDFDVVVIGYPDIYVDKNITVGITTAKIDVTSNETSICCCKGDLWESLHFFYIYTNCGDNEDCKNCRSFTITNLVPGRDYSFKYYLPNRTSIDFDFMPKYSKANLTFIQYSISLIATVESNYELKNTECNFEIILHDEVVEHCSGTCDSCYNHTFSNLIVETNYIVNYKNDYLENIISRNIVTGKSDLQYSLDITKNFHSTFVTITTSAHEIGSCNVAAHDSKGIDIETNCYLNIHCTSCKNFTILGLNPGEQYEIKITFINHYKFKFINITTDVITITQNYKQTGVLKINVTVLIKTMSHYVYSCHISFNTTQASCEGPCPTDCADYTVILKSKTNFEAIISSTESNADSVMTVKLDQYEISLTSTVITGKYATFMFKPNFPNGGICIVEFWSQNKQITPDCSLKKCSQDCDSLTLNVSNLYNYSNVDIFLKNDNLEIPYYTSTLLDYGVLLDDITMFTTDSVFLQVLHGKNCCCDVKLLLKNSLETVNYFCKDNEDCRKCRSFNIKNLLPNTDYQVEFTTPTSEKIVKYFKTRAVVPSLIVKVYFNFTVIKIDEAHSNQTKICKFEVKIQNIILNSCNRNCSSCRYLFIFPMAPEGRYTISYQNIFMEKAQQTFFDTFAPRYELPKVVQVSQMNVGLITFTINNETKYNYNVTYRIFKYNQSNAVGNYRLIITGKLYKMADRIDIDIFDDDRSYYAVFCFKVNEDLCLSDTSLYTCTHCILSTFSVCSSQNLYPKGGDLSVDSKTGKLELLYDNVSLSCHNKMQCFFGIAYVLRKHDLKNLTTVTRKFMLRNSLEGNLIIYYSLNHSECFKNNKIELTNLYFSRLLDQIQKMEVYSTPIIALCDTKKCLLSDYTSNFSITNSGTRYLIAFTIFIVLGLIFFTLSLILVITKETNRYVYNHQGLNIPASNINKNIEMNDELSPEEENKHISNIPKNPTIMIRNKDGIKKGNQHAAVTNENAEIEQQ